MMNGQVVLCKSVNDGEELRRTIADLGSFLPYMESLSIVPVGLSKYREGLYPLQPFTKEDAQEVIRTIHYYQKIFMEEYDTHFVHASDEWYILAEEPLPDEENYDGYIQLENGVGMLRLQYEEFHAAMEEDSRENRGSVIKECTIATGRLAGPYIQKLIDDFNKKYPSVVVHVVEVTNHFFGPRITVSGLLTGQDIITALKDRKLGSQLMLPVNVLRAGEDVLLDDMTIADIERTLQVPIRIVQSNGQDLYEALLS